MSPAILATRAERVAEAQRLRAQGLKMREIAEEMGQPISTIDGYINDPDREKQKARFARYGGSCPKCGGPRDGHHGPGMTDDQWCQACRSSEPHSLERASRTAHQRTGAFKWSDDQILDSLRKFHARYGKCSVNAWNRHRSRQRPAALTIETRFGGWNAALQAAGLPTVRVPGRQYERVTLDGCVLALQIVGDVISGIPTVATYNRIRIERPELGLPSEPLIRIRWGTWVAALEAAFGEQERAA